MAASKGHDRPTDNDAALPPRRFLSLRPASDYLDVGASTLRRHFLEGRIRAYRFGTRDLKFDVADLDAYLTEAVPTQADKRTGR